MKITEITYSVGKTIQIKAFEPLNLHASIKAEVSPKEDLKKAYAEIKAIVGNQIKADIQELQDKKTEAENKVKYPFGACSTCSAPLAKSKAGNLYCPNSIPGRGAGTPHQSKTQLTEAEQKFSDNLK